MPRNDATLRAADEHGAAGAAPKRSRGGADGDPAPRAGAATWSAGAVRFVQFGPAALVAAAIVALLLGLGFGGGASPVALADPGPLVRWGLPMLRLAYNLAAAVTIGALVFASCVVSRTGPEFERVMRIASGAATAWAVATAGAAFFSYLQISGVPFSASPGFGEQLRFFFTEIDLGRLWLLDLVMILVLSIVVFAVRSMWGIGLATLLALFALWPLASQGHAAGAANHETAIGGITLHYTGAAVWLGGLVLVALVAPTLAPARRYDLVQRFSGLALVAFAVTAFSGIVAAVINVGSWEALAEPYGVLVVLKFFALVGLGIFGALQRRMLIARMRPAHDGSAKRAPLAWLIGLELALMGIAGGLAAALGRTPSVVQEVTADQLADPTPAQLLSGNELPPPFEVSRLFTEWRLDPIWTTLCVLGIVLYVVGVVRLHRRGDRWPVLRTVSFTVGALLLLYLVNGGLVVYGQFLFSAHMSQHMVLSMITPIFLTLGAPMTLLLRAVPARHDGSTGAREWAMSIIHSRFSRFFTHPIVASVLFAGSLLIFYYTPLFRWAVTDHVGHMWMVADFLLVGYFFTQSLIGIDPVPNRAPYPLRLLALVLVMTFHAFFGLSIMTGTGLLMADWYGATGRTWGSATALEDQQLGGAISWGLGEFPTVVLALLVAVSWYRSDEREQRRTDRRAARDGDAELKAYNEQLRALAERDRAAEARRAAPKRTTARGDDE